MPKDFPEPTPPKETSAAQTGTSVSTAVANAFLQNPSEVTPWGSTAVNPTGTYAWTDPYTGQRYDIPTFTRTTTLSPSGQATKEQTDAAQFNLGALANQQSAFLRDYLAQPFDPNMDYSWDTSGATPETRRWVSYDGSAGPSSPAASAPTGFQAGTFKPMSRQEWEADFQKNQWPQIQPLLPNDGGVYLPQTTQAMYDDYLKHARADFDTAERNRYTDWAMQTGAAPSAASVSGGPSGYWEVTPGTSGRWVATPKTGANKLQDWTAMPNDDYEESRKRVEDALFARLEPKLAGDRAALENRLANAGLTLGSDLYSKGTDEFNRQSTDARMAAILAGGDEQTRLFNMDLTRAGFNNTLRQQQIQEAYAQRAQPLNEILALLSGSQIAPPQFMGANMPTIPTTDNAGIIANYDNQRMQAAQAENQMFGQLLGGLFGLGGKIIGARPWA
jgi:hypothetical protein